MATREKSVKRYVVRLSAEQREGAVPGLLLRQQMVRRNTSQLVASVSLRYLRADVNHPLIFMPTLSLRAGAHAESIRCNRSVASDPRRSGRVRP